MIGLRMRSPLRVAPLAALLLLAAPPAAAGRRQAPHAPWATIATAHYRIHYPSGEAAGFAPFAREVASRIEGIHAEVVRWVGYEARGPVHVVLRDPVGEANGMAFPLLSAPWVELWRTPPESDSAIGFHRGWADLLVAHELAHVHHLARPQEEPTFVERLAALPVGPVALKAPRWVTEGYATLVEGRVTGSGRPFSPYRAAVLRAFALAGRLPEYGSLSRTGGYRRGGMAYLVGSAFLEWLERRQGGDPELLPRFWRQLSSPERRGFGTAFRATFGDPPDVLYDRFRAEVTHDALALERRMGSEGLREGEPWARVEGEVTDLSVSPDGQFLLLRDLTPRAPGLALYDLAAPPAGEEAARRRRDEGLPEDLPEVPPRREAIHRLPRLDGAVPEKPSFRADGTVRFLLRLPDAEGVLERRPHVWRPGEGVREALSGVDLPPAGPLSVEREASGAFVTIGAARLALPFDPVGPFRLDASGEFVYGAAAVGGIWNVVRAAVLDAAGSPRLGDLELLTRTTTAAWGPAPSPDGKSLFFLRLTARGTEVRRLDLSPGGTPLPAPAPAVPGPFTVATVLPPPVAAGSLPAPVEPPPSGPYRIGDSTRIGWRSGASVSPSGTSYELGAGGSDLLGHLSWQALGALGDAAGPRGAAVSATSRAFSAAPSATLFTALERPSAQRFVPAQGSDRQRTGAALSFRWESLGRTRLSVEPHGGVERISPAEGASPPTTRLLAGATASVSRGFSRGERWGVRLTAAGTAQAGATGGDGWCLGRLAAGLRVRTPVVPLEAVAEGGAIGGTPGRDDLFRLGGSTTGLVPDALQAPLVAQTALPSWLATGDRLLRLRVSAGRWLRVYLEHTAVWGSGADRAPFQRVAGLEAVLDAADLVPQAVWRVGRLSLTAGVHRTLDGEMKGRTVATLGLLTRP